MQDLTYFATDNGVGGVTLPALEQANRQLTGQATFYRPSIDAGELYLEVGAQRVLLTPLIAPDDPGTTQTVFRTVPIETTQGFPVGSVPVLVWTHDGVENRSDAPANDIVCLPHSPYSSGDSSVHWYYAWGTENGSRYGAAQILAVYLQETDVDLGGVPEEPTGVDTIDLLELPEPAALNASDEAQAIYFP